MWPLDNTSGYNQRTNNRWMRPNAASNVINSERTSLRSKIAMESGPFILDHEKRCWLSIAMAAMLSCRAKRTVRGLLWCHVMSWFSRDLHVIWVSLRTSLLESRFYFHGTRKDLYIPKHHDFWGPSCQGPVPFWGVHGSFLGLPLPHGPTLSRRLVLVHICHGAAIGIEDMNLAAVSHGCLG